MVAATTAPQDPRWVYLDQVRKNAGPFTTEEFDLTEAGLSRLGQMKVLLVTFLDYTKEQKLIYL
jgi:hypothetical protein